MSEIMNHFRFASSASVGELIVNFNNPGFSHLSQFLYRLYYPTIYFVSTKLTLTFISWSQSFRKLRSKRPKLQRHRHWLHILLCCLHVQAHRWHLQERCGSQKKSFPLLTSLFSQSESLWLLTRDAVPSDSTVETALGSVHRKWFAFKEMVPKLVFHPQGDEN